MRKRWFFFLFTFLEVTAGTFREVLAMVIQYTDDQWYGNARGPEVEGRSTYRGRKWRLGFRWVWLDVWSEPEIPEALATLLTKTSSLKSQRTSEAHERLVQSPNPFRLRNFLLSRHPSILKVFPRPQKKKKKKCRVGPLPLVRFN